MAPDPKQAEPVKLSGDFGQTVAGGAKLLLEMTNQTSAAFPPLQSVTGGLLFLVQHYEVCVNPLVRQIG